jgi:hypothetical protein
MMITPTARAAVDRLHPLQPRSAFDEGLHEKPSWRKEVSLNQDDILSCLRSSAVVVLFGKGGLPAGGDCGVLESLWFG